jgi:glucokinase
VRVNPVTVLAADIGGTNARLALFESGGREPLCAETYPTAATSGAAEIIREFLSAHPARPAAACLAVAGPVQGGRSAPVNIRWTIDARQLAHALLIPALRVVNDLEANARGTTLLDGVDLAVVEPGRGRRARKSRRRVRRHRPRRSSPRLERRPDCRGPDRGPAGACRSPRAR